MYKKYLYRRKFMLFIGIIICDDIIANLESRGCIIANPGFIDKVQAANG